MSSPPTAKRPKHSSSTSNTRRSDGDNVSLYLDTVDRSSLNFDFEKVCSVTLSKVNVYGCLVCGKYLQGRSQSSPAYLHSLETGHHVYINFSNEKFFILPENYEVTSPTTLRLLSDIRHYLNPKYEESDIQNLNGTCFDLEKKPYSRGFVGLDNVKSDYLNVVIQLIAHTDPIRDFYLIHGNSDSMKNKSPLNFELSALMRQMWSKHLFRSHVSPNGFIHLVHHISNNKFGTTEQSATPKSFLVWILNFLHTQLQKSTGSSRTVISKAFQGKIEIKTIKSVTKEINNKVEYFNSKTASTSKTKFWVLTLDLPPEPIFSKDSAIREVLFEDLLKKFNGRQTSATDNEMRTLQLIGNLPKFLIFHVDRNLESAVNKKGNTTVVRFPNELNMGPYVKDNKDELIYKPKMMIIHKNSSGTSLDSQDRKSEWYICIRNGEKWVSITNAEVKSCDFELLFLEQIYIQVWERK